MKGLTAYALNTVGHDNVNQSGAAVKSQIPNRLKTVGSVQVHKAGAIAESGVFDRFNTVTEC